MQFRVLAGKSLARGENNSPDGGGMEMQNTRMSRNMVNISLDQQLDGDDLIDFNEVIPKINNIGSLNLTESTFLRHTYRTTSSAASSALVNEPMRVDTKLFLAFY